MSDKCSALTRLRDGRGYCANGFPTHPACDGSLSGKLVPFCCREEWCGRVYADNGGKPNPLDDARSQAIADARREMT